MRLSQRMPQFRVLEVEARRCDRLCLGSPSPFPSERGVQSRNGAVPAGGSPAAGLPMSVTLRSGLFFVAEHYAAHYRTFTTSLAWVSGTSGIATKLSAEHSFSLPLARGFSGHTDLAPHYDARSGTLLRPKLPGLACPAEKEPLSVTAVSVRKLPGQVSDWPNLGHMVTGLGRGQLPRSHGRSKGEQVTRTSR